MKRHKKRARNNIARWAPTIVISGGTWGPYKQGSFDYHFWGNQTMQMLVILRDFPLIMHCLGW